MLTMHQNRKIISVRDTVVDRRMLEVRSRNGKKKEAISILVRRGWIGDADNERLVFSFLGK